MTASPPSPLKRIGSLFLRPHRRTLALCLAATFLQAFMALPVPLAQGQVLDRLVAGGAADPGLVGHLALALAVVCGCLLGRAVVGWRVGVAMTRVSLEVVRELTNALHRKLQRLPLAYLDRNQTGGIMARLTSDVGSLMIFLNSGTLQLATDLVLAAGVVGVLFWLNVPLAIVALVAAPLYALNRAAFAGPLRRQSDETRAHFGRLYAYLGERLPALRVVRAFGQEAAEVGRLDQYQVAHAAAARSTAGLGAWQLAAANFGSGVATIAVIVGGAHAVSSGRMSPGGLLAFYTLTALLFGPLTRLAQFQAGVAATRVAVARMLELLDEPEGSHARSHSDSGESGCRSPAPDRTPGEMAVNRVTFRYQPEASPVLSDVDLRVPKGGTVGVIGPSGSGKSTLLALLGRLYDAGPGAVTLDGVDVWAWGKGAYRGAVALVPQRPVLFAGTVRQNLAYAAPAASTDQLWEALAVVELADLVRSLPGGLDAPLGPGGEGLSGGQRQRLALARALLTDSAVYLFDDCTSALDATTEARVRANLAAACVGRTRVIATHKPAAVRDADEILVLEGGRAVERGTHDELIARGGRYADLVSLHQRCGLARTEGAS